MIKENRSLTEEVCTYAVDNFLMRQSEDITFCANRDCADMKCHRNPKHICILDIPHSFALFDKCPKWSHVGAAWLIKQMEGEAYEP